MRCERHRPFSKHLSWNDRVALEKAHLAAGLWLQQCQDCRQWFFPWQMEEVPPREPTGLRWVCCHPGLWMLHSSTHRRLGTIHMFRPGRWETSVAGTVVVTWHETPAEAAYALAQDIRKIS